MIIELELDFFISRMETDISVVSKKMKYQELVLLLDKMEMSLLENSKIPHWFFKFEELKLNEFSFNNLFICLITKKYINFYDK